MSPSHRLSSPHQDDDDDGDDNISLLSLPDDDSDSDGEASLSHSITKDDILPMSAKDMAALQDAVVTMQISRELFKSWDKVLRENGKSSAVSRSVVEELHDTVKKLLSQSSKALGAAKKMLDAHCRYSRALYESLKSSSTTGHLEITRDMEREVEKIQANARLYSDTVALMKDTLQSLTEQLGEAVKRAKKKDSWKKILLKWLRRFLRVLASLFAVGSALSVFAGPLIGAGLGAGSVLGKALAAIIPKDEKETEDHSDKLLHFLKYTLKNEVSDACDRLAGLDDCYKLMTEVMYESQEQTFAIEEAVAKEMKIRWRRQFNKLYEIRKHTTSTVVAKVRT